MPDGPAFRNSRSARAWRALLPVACLTAASLFALVLSAPAAMAQRRKPAPRPRPAPRAALPSRTAGADAAAPARISMSFSAVDVREAVVRVAQYAKIDVLLCPGVEGVVSVSLRDRTPEEAIRMLAASAGLSMVRSKGAYIVGQAADVRKALGEFGSTAIVALKHLKPESAVELLSKAAPTVKAEAGQGVVVLSGVIEDVQVARERLGEFDVEAVAPPVRSESRILVMRFADPVSVEQIVKQALPTLELTRHERTLVLIGPAADVATATKAVEAIDVEQPADVPLKVSAVYQMKYLNAKRAEEALKKALPGVVVAASPEPNVPGRAQFRPLTGASSMFEANSSTSGASSSGMQGQSGQSGQGSEIDVVPFNKSRAVILVGPEPDVKMATKILEELDVPQPLIRIDAALVEVTSGALDQLGVEWKWADGGFNFGIKLDPNADTGNVGTGKFTGGAPQVSAFSAALSALVEKRKANVLASPNIACLDREDAFIFIGEQRRFVGSSVVNATNQTLVQGTETVPVGVALLVCPMSHPDGSISMRVHPVVSSISGYVGNLPQTSGREAETVLRLKPGEELVIGGLDHSEKSGTTDKVPLLGDLPLLGQLFRSKSNSSTKTEVVLFLRAYTVDTTPAPKRNFAKGGSGQ